MEFRILKLNVYIDVTGKIILKNGDLTIEKEQLINSYDFILIYCDNSCHIVLEPILKSQNYVYYGNGYHNMKSIYSYVNNELKKNMYVCTGSGYYMNFDIHNKIFLFGDRHHDFFQDKLPCFILTRFPSDIKYFENIYKITKIDLPDLYYLERKGQFTKAAIK